VFDFGVLPEGQPFIVMEYMDGSSLGELIAREGALSVSRCMNIFQQVLSGLAAAHEKGIIHRDVKPSNIFISAGAGGDVAKLLEFGLAKLTNPDETQGHLTQTGQTIGTPDYMSPEQCY